MFRNRFLFLLSLFALAPSAFSQGETQSTAADAGTYVVRTLKAVSSKDDPNALTVTTSFESKDLDGNVVKDSRNEVVDISGFDGYSIRMNDNDAGFEIGQADASDMRAMASDFPYCDYFDDAFADMRAAMCSAFGAFRPAERSFRRRGSGRMAHWVFPMFLSPFWF